MSGRRTVLVSAVLAFLGTAVAASPATAATKRISPLDFTPVDSSVNVLRSPIAFGAGAVAASFAAPLVLPTGARITGFRAYSNGVAAMRIAGIAGRNSTDTISVAQVIVTDASPDLLTPLLSTGVVLDPSVATIQPNRIYFVLASCSPGTAFWAVDVDFIP